jgi:hypothetical protein
MNTVNGSREGEENTKKNALFPSTLAHSHIHIISYLMLLHGNDGYANAPKCYGARTFPVLLFNVTKRVYTHEFDCKSHLQIISLKTATQWHDGGSISSYRSHTC